MLLGLRSRKIRGRTERGSVGSDGRRTVRFTDSTRQRREFPHSDLPARFVGNPHVIAATKDDYQVLPPDVKSTFPEPLPVYLSRNAPVSTLTPARKPDPNSSSAGRFSLSVKGVRKDLRKAGARAQHLVKDVESEIVSWLHDGTVFLSPDEKDPNDLEFPGKPVGGSGAIHEVARTPLQLVWAISEDGFARYVVHCCARYHDVVSFSKYLLRTMAIGVYADHFQAKTRRGNASPTSCGPTSAAQATKPRIWIHLLPQI
jgi:hypothetical protein